MPNRKPSKSKHYGHLTRARFLAMPKPPGEDFFVISLIADDPDHPTWEFRTSSMGDWDAIKRFCSLFEFQHNSRIVFFQGDNARRYLQRSLKDEQRFQQERSAEPNN